MDWMGVKAMLASLVLEKDAIHIYSALLIQLVAAALTRKTLRDWQPWLAVLAFALINESLDVTLGEEASIEPWQIRGATHDLVNTMLLPSVLMLLSRHRPGLFWPPRPEVADANEHKSSDSSC